MFVVAKEIGSGVEQIIYEHLLHVVKTEPPAQVLTRFRTLFIEGIGYRDTRIWTTLEKLALEKNAEQNFPLLINRCCYILVNHWQMQLGSQHAIAELIFTFQNITDIRMTYSRIGRRLRSLLEIYLHSQDYLKLNRLNVVLNATATAKPTRHNIAELPLGNLINRYPYLYDHSLVSEERTFENVETVRRVQQNLHQKYELSLSQYLTYQARRARLIAQLGREAAQDLPQVSNPTLLSTRELGAAFHRFVGKAEGDASYRDLSRGFAARIESGPTIKSFKDDLYEYIVSGVDGDYGKRSFNDRFYKTICNILPDRDRQRLDEVSLLRGCTHILNHLLVESPQKPQHFVFVDLISNLGVVFTTGLLLKIVLICQKAKPLIESRFSMLFNHYESSNCNGVPWLVKSLETWNVAETIHFGKIDAASLMLLGRG
jgi:hypothetical protein